jgi:hypothetical protein
VGLVIWLLTGGALTMSLSLSLLYWPVMFILAGGFVAVALICVSILVPKSQLEQAPKSFRYVLILGGGLGLGMFLQTVPLELFGLANPLWSAAGAAIGKPMAGYITVDTASTVAGLTKYLVMLGTGLAVALACSDQKRSAQMAYEIVWLLAIFLVINAGFNELQSAEMKARFWAEWRALVGPV